TTDYTYDGSGHILTLTAVLPTGTPPERTQYVYTTSSVPGSAVASNDLLVMVGHPDRTTGLPNLNDATLTEKYTYNGARQQRTARWDRNGTQHDYAYDVVGRRTSDTTTLATGSQVDNAVRTLEKAYDSAGRPYLFTSRNPSGTVVTQVQYDFNGFS